MRKFLTYLNENMSRRKFVFGGLSAAAGALLLGKNIIDKTKASNNPEEFENPLPDFKEYKPRLKPGFSQEDPDEKNLKHKKQEKYKHQEEQRQENLPESLVNFIKKEEGFRSQAYYDEKGILTIGYGFTNAIIPSLNSRSTITEQESDKLIRKILLQYADLVKKTINHDLTTNELTALVSLAYNIGPNAFKNSFVVQYINAGKKQEAASQFRHWARVKNRRSKGLASRREREKNLFLKESTLNCC